MAKKVRLVARHCFDILIFVGLCFTVYAIEKWWTPQKRGFFCDDDSLHYPYHSNTVSANTLIFLVLSVPTLVMLATELLQLTNYNQINYNNHHGSNNNNNNNNINNKQHLKNKKAQRAKSNLAPEKQNCLHTIYQRLRRCYMHIGHYLFGLALTLIATSVTKLCVGRLRPHFFSICDPILPDGSNCSDEQNVGRYIDVFNCNAKSANVTEAHLRDVGLSFPSGHASLFFYAMVYIALYLQLTLSLSISKLLKHVLQFICLLSAVYVGLTRISDFKHHWTDVLAGGILGTVMACSIICCVAKYFQRNSLNQGWLLSADVEPQRVNGVNRTTKMPQVNATAMLPAYTFGTLPYLSAPPNQHHNQHQHQYHYHNYGYVP